jgi:thiol-disulfide isomerase/thioredoxin
VLVAFWATDCAYCYEELDLLLQWGKQNPKVKIALVSTDPPANRALVIDALQKHGYQVETTYQFADTYAERIRYDVDKRWMGELPRTYFLKGTTTKSTSGALSEKQLQEWLAIKK